MNQKISISRNAEEMYYGCNSASPPAGDANAPSQPTERYKIKPGDTFRVLDLDGILVLTPMVPIVPELAREIERARVEAGLNIEELLASLRKQRERYVREKYGRKRR